MANYFHLVLDTTGPSSPTLSLESGAQYATNVLVQANIGTSDSVTTNYQMKIWGDIDLTWGKNNGIFSSGATGTAEANALWISYTTVKQLQLTTGDGAKTVYLKIRDDVYNESAQISDSINLDTTIPTVTLTGPDVPKVSERDGKNVASFSFSVDSAFVEYKVKVVSSAGATHDTGTQIGIANGSVNMSGTGTFASTTPINCTINGTDLKTASSVDGDKIIKVFVRDGAGFWSV